MMKIKRKVGYIVGILVCACLIILTNSHFKPEIEDMWKSGDHHLHLDKTSEVLTIDRKIKAYYVDGKSLPGGRAVLLFARENCQYELTISENGSAHLQTLLGGLCPYYDKLFHKVDE